MKNVFKILAREESVKTDNLRKLLSPLGEVEIILDVEGDIEGYTGMTGKWKDSTTAWDILFKDLEEEYTWIIEDDVAFNKDTIESIFNIFKFKETDFISNWVRHRNTCVCWCWWGLLGPREPNFKPNRVTKSALFTDIKISESWKSLNCFCRVSPNLIKKTKSFIKKHKKGLFHEILLPTLAETRTDFRDTCIAGYFEQDNYNWDKNMVKLGEIQEYKVYHPVKADEKHTEICNCE